MTRAVFQFDTYQSIASDVGEEAWSNPGNAEVSDNNHSTASLSSFGTSVATEYLVCTGADLSSLPANILFTKIEVNIEAQGATSELFEVFGCESDGSGGLTIGSLNLLRPAGRAGGTLHKDVRRVSITSETACIRVGRGAEPPNGDCPHGMETRGVCGGGSSDESRRYGSCGGSAGPLAIGT